VMFAAGDELRAQTPPSAPDDPTVAEARALHASRERPSSDRAVAMLEEYLRSSPHDTGALFALGEVHLERGVRYTPDPPPSLPRPRSRNS
jgi:hypothetical protein